MRTLTIDEQKELDNILADALKIRHSEPGAARIKIEAVRDYIQYFNSLGPIDFGDNNTGVLCQIVEQDGAKLLAKEKLPDIEHARLQTLAEKNRKQINDWREQIRLNRPSRVYPSLKEARESLETLPPLVETSFDTSTRRRLGESKKAQTTFTPEAANQDQSQGNQTPTIHQEVNTINNPTFLMRLWTAPMTKTALCLLMVSAVLLGLTGVGLIIEAGAIVAGTLLATAVGLFAISAKLTTDTYKKPQSTISA